MALNVFASVQPLLDSSQILRHVVPNFNSVDDLSSGREAKRKLKCDLQVVVPSHVTAEYQRRFVTS